MYGFVGQLTKTASVESDDHTMHDTVGVTLQKPTVRLGIKNTNLLFTQPDASSTAGIISGAQGINPGITLRQTDAFDTGPNVALSGRVYVQADASYGAIKPGEENSTYTQSAPTISRMKAIFGSAIAETTPPRAGH